MYRFGRLCLILGAFVSATALAQLTVPRIIQLPTSDFIWNWGRPPTIDRPTRPDFAIQGSEREFRCTLTGDFRPASVLSEYRTLRDWEFSLSGSIYFIQAATADLNTYYQANQLAWATLDCRIPETGPVDEDKTQERIDRALERAQRQRERRRESDEDN